CYKEVTDPHYTEWDSFPACDHPSPVQSLCLPGLQGFITEALLVFPGTKYSSTETKNSVDGGPHRGCEMVLRTRYRKIASGETTNINLLGREQTQ
ncbi:unnamed protein product, partial [Lepidochelys kempii]